MFAPLPPPDCTSVTNAPRHSPSCSPDAHDTTCKSIGFTVIWVTWGLYRGSMEGI